MSLSDSDDEDSELFYDATEYHSSNPSVVGAASVQSSRNSSRLSAEIANEKTNSSLTMLPVQPALDVSHFGTPETNTTHEVMIADVNQPSCRHSRSQSAQNAPILIKQVPEANDAAYMAALRQKEATTAEESNITAQTSHTGTHQEKNPEYAQSNDNFLIESKKHETDTSFHDVDQRGNLAKQSSGSIRDHSLSTKDHMHVPSRSPTPPTVNACIDQNADLQRKSHSTESERPRGLFAQFKKALHISEKNDLSSEIVIKAKKKINRDFCKAIMLQRLVHHKGPIWAMAISPDGEYIATGGEDGMIRIYTVIGSAESVNYPIDSEAVNELPEEGRFVINPCPFRVFIGHRADIVDLAWSNSNFLLSGSIDKTVRLWHVSRSKCLCLFHHPDFVTAVSFHPIQDCYFMSGSFDRKVRIWSIPDQRVIEWAHTQNVITSVAFSPDGQRSVCGLYNGVCCIYKTAGLKLFTQMDCKNRKGKFSKGKKITGLQFDLSGTRLLVTTNDSRIRLFDMESYAQIKKFKGLHNEDLQIRASFDDIGAYIMSGSEDNHVYIWRVGEDVNVIADTVDKHDDFEYFNAYVDTVTVAKFLPSCSTALTSANLNKSIAVVAGYGGELSFLNFCEHQCRI